MPIRTVRDELSEVSRRLTDIADLAEKEGRDISAAEQFEVVALRRRGELLRAKLPENGATLDDLLKHVAPGAGGAVARAGAPGESIGEAFTRSGAFQAIAANLPTSAPWHSAPVEVPFPRLQATALLSPTGGWGPGVAAPPPVVPTVPRVASLFAQGTASGGMVFYPRDSGQTTAAAVVAEGVAKPEMSLVLPQIEAQLVTLAIWSAVSNQTLEDVESFRSWLDGVFRLDLLDKLDDEVLNGTGTGGRMLGVLPCPGLTGPIAWTTPETAADAIARAIAAVYAASRMSPDAIVIDPSAYVAMLTAKASTAGTYLSGAAMSAAPLSLLWGVPVVPSPAMASGTALVGNFARGGTLYGKQGLRIQASSEHSDYFTRNLTAILGELRGVLAIQRPPAFCKVTGLPVPA